MSDHLCDDKTRAEKIELVRVRFERFAAQQATDRMRSRDQSRTEEREITRTLRQQRPRLKR